MNKSRIFCMSASFALLLTACSGTATPSSISLSPSSVSASESTSPAPTPSVSSSSASSSTSTENLPSATPSFDIVSDLSEILSDKQLEVYNQPEKTNQMFFIDAFNISTFYGKNLIGKETEKFEIAGSKNTYYYADLDWNQFEKDMLKIFTKDCFASINTRFISSQDNSVLCLHASSSISQSFEGVDGYELISSDENEVAFHILANYGSETKKVLIRLSSTPDGWRVSEFHSMYTA